MTNEPSENLGISDADFLDSSLFTPEINHTPQVTSSLTSLFPTSEKWNF